VLKIRCGLHRRPGQRRDGDYFGPELNRAARIMASAHGGQVLMSQAVADAVADRLPAPAALRALGAGAAARPRRPEPLWPAAAPAAARGLSAAAPQVADTPTNLPQPLNSFVGRERELPELRARLPAHAAAHAAGHGRHRQVAAVAAAGRHGAGRPRCIDGVWVVELAPVDDPQLLPQAVASVLGVKEEPGMPLDRRAAPARGQPPPAAGAGQLRAPAGRGLRAGQGSCCRPAPACACWPPAASRAQVAGEAVCPVPPLGLPDDPAATPDDALQHGAVRLFVDRARSAQPAFAADGRQCRRGAICRALDGIPLALELAAARLRALPVQALADRLRDSFALVATRDTTVAPRQRTLQTLIDWSHDLLAADERVLYRRLSVFAGGWTLEAAEAVCAGDGLDLGDVADLLAALAEKSLVDTVANADGAQRYRMLDTVRAYADEKLAADPATRRPRGGGMSDFRRSLPSGPTPWKLRAASRRGLAAASMPSATTWLQLVFVLKAYWRTRGLLGLGHRVTVEALARTRPDERSFGRCRVLCDAGQLCWFMGRHEEARRYLEESRAIAHELGDAGRIGAVLQPLGMTYLALGDRAAAQALYEATVAMAAEAGNRRVLMVASNSLAQLHRADGRLDAAEPLYQRVIALAREMGDRESIAIGLLNQAMVLVTRGDTAAAGPLLAEVGTIAADVGSQPVAQSLLEVCAGLAAARGRADAALWLYGAAEARAARTGIRRDANDDAFLLPLLARARSALPAEAAAAAEAAGRDAGDAAVDTAQLQQLGAA
jgi:predicted ATPase